MGRVKQITAPDGAITHHEYYPSGLLVKTHGGRVYPVEYTYDVQGRMKTMKTWQNFAGNGGAATTTWNYDPYRGWLAAKRDQSNAGCDYFYTAGGRLWSRFWARFGIGSQRVGTAYTYGFQNASNEDDHGDLTGVAYTADPASTPGITHTYDRRGRRLSTTQNGTIAYTYHDSGALLSEEYTGGTLAGMNIQYTLDSFLRRSSVTARNGTTALATTSYTYDNASRLASVGDGTYSASYAYLANSPLISQITFNLETAVAHAESSQDPGDKTFPNHSPDPQGICLPLRQAFLIQAFANLQYVQLPFPGSSKTPRRG